MTVAAYTEKVHDAFTPEVAEYFSNYVIGDIGADELVEAFGPIETFDPETYEVVCDECGHSIPLDHDWTIDGASAICPYCTKKQQARDEFYALVESVEAVIEQSDWGITHTSIASTNTHYFTIEKDDDENDEPAVLKIRVADHGECYCNEDYSIDPFGYSAQYLAEILAKK